MNATNHYSLKKIIQTQHCCSRIYHEAMWLEEMEVENKTHIENVQLGKALDLNLYVHSFPLRDMDVVGWNENEFYSLRSQSTIS